MATRATEQRKCQEVQGAGVGLCSHGSGNIQGLGGAEVMESLPCLASCLATSSKAVVLSYRNVRFNSKQMSQPTLSRWFVSDMRADFLVRSHNTFTDSTND